jgi:hypothetical protein
VSGAPSPDQLRKLDKHGLGSGVFKFNSRFTDPSPANQQAWTAAAVMSGHLEIDHRGRHNLFIFAGQQVGASYMSGAQVASNYAVKAVLADNPVRVHGFPFDLLPGSHSCDRCNRPLM